MIVKVCSVSEFQGVRLTVSGRACESNWLIPRKLLVVPNVDRVKQHGNSIVSVHLLIKLGEVLPVTPAVTIGDSCDRHNAYKC